MNTGALNIITSNESGDSKSNNMNPSSIANTSHEPRKYRGGNLPKLSTYGDYDVFSRQARLFFCTYIQCFLLGEDSER